MTYIVGLMVYVGLVLTGLIYFAESYLRITNWLIMIIGILRIVYDSYFLPGSLTFLHYLWNHGMWHNYFLTLFGVEAGIFWKFWFDTVVADALVTQRTINSCGIDIGIDHDTVCAGVGGTAIRHSTSCAGRRLRPRRPAQRVLCLMAVPPTTARTV